MKVKEEKLLIESENIKPTSKNMEVIGTLNPGVERLPDNKIIMYVRVIEKLKKPHDSRYFYSPRFAGREEVDLVIDKFKKKLVKHEEGEIAFDFKDGTKRLTYISHLRRVILDESGFNVLKIDPKPSFYGTKKDSELGVEDARITKIDGKYCMTYVGLGRNENISTNLAVSEDGINWERKGIIFGEQDKDVVLFPEKINGKYIAFDRPEGNFEFSPPHIWIAYSKNLEYWGKLKPIHLKKHFNFSRSGAGPPPIKTDKGWLLIFHGVTKTHPKTLINYFKRIFGIKIEGKDSYAVWAALFDLKDPKKIIARSPRPLLIPKRDKHLSFEEKLVIFPTGAVMDLDGKHLLLYSGLGDTRVGVQKIAMDELMKSLEKVKD